MTWIVWTCQVQHFNPATDSDPMGWTWHGLGQVGPPLQSPNPDLGQWPSNGMNPSGTLPPKLIRRCWSQNQSNVFKGVCPKHSLSPHRKTWKNLVSPQNWRCEVGLLKTWTVTPTKFCNGCLSSQWQREKHAKNYSIRIPSGKKYHQATASGVFGGPVEKRNSWNRPTTPHQTGAPGMGHAISSLHWVPPLACRNFGSKSEGWKKKD